MRMGMPGLKYPKLVVYLPQSKTKGQTGCLFDAPSVEQA